MQKIPVQGQALIGTLFWMELCGKQIVFGNGTCKRTAVISFGSNMACIMGFCEKAVYKIEITAIGDVAPNWVLHT